MKQVIVPLPPVQVAIVELVDAAEAEAEHLRRQAAAKRAERSKPLEAFLKDQELAEC